jgi:hypothetical protein
MQNSTGKEKGSWTNGGNKTVKGNIGGKNMYCQNCGAEISTEIKFCPKCGTKVIVSKKNGHVEGENMEIDGTEQLDAFEPDISEKNNKTAELATIPQLKDHLMALRDAGDSDAALTYAVEAQLQVLDVLNSPSLTSSTFDLMIESLHKALRRTTDEYQVTELQNKAAIMAKNMVFFMEAKLRYEENKHSEDGKMLLKKGCSMLAESASAIVSGGVSAGVKIMGGKLFDNLMDDNGFFSMLFDFIGKKERIQKNKEEFNSFLENFIGKLDRYRDIFGKSILLSELVYQYKDRLIENQEFDEPEEPCGFIYRAAIWIKTLFLIGALSGLSYIPVAVGWFSQQDWLDNVPFLAISLWIMINLFYLISCILNSIREKIAYKKALKAYTRQSEYLENYYVAIAEAYNITNKSKTGKTTMPPNYTSKIRRSLTNYERIHGKRANLLSGEKSWLTTMILCLFLGFIGAHRFYVGKIGTGILMLVLTTTGISVIWAIVDLILIFSGKFTDKEGNIIR